MRWKPKETKLLTKYILKEERTIKKFLFLPLTLSSTLLEKETRWLEVAEIVQRVYKIDVGGSGEWGKYIYKWYNVRWKE